MLLVKNISYKVSNFLIVNNVTLNVNSGEIVSVIGPNGSGKTTLFNIINGFLLPSSGEIYFDELSVTSLNVFKKVHLGIGRMWQDSRIFSKMTVLENLIASVKNNPGDSIFRNLIRTRKFQKKQAEIRDQALYYAELVGLKDKIGTETENLSFGQQKLVAICRLFMNESKLLLLDEPFAGVNYVYIERIQELILKLKENKRAVLLIEHNIAMAKNLSQRMYAMSEGAIISEGDPNEVISSSELRKAYAGI